MCRNIKKLRQPSRPPTGEELNNASLQFVRKISGFHSPSEANREAFERAATEIADASQKLFKTLQVQTRKNHALDHG